MPTAPKRHKQTKNNDMTIHKRRDIVNKNKLYDRKWRKARRAYLEEHPLCEECLDNDRITPARDIDHVIPLSEGGARLDCSNFRALCRRCHNRKTHGKGKL